MGMSRKFTSRSGLSPNPMMPVHEPASSVAPSTTSEQFQAAGQGTGQTTYNDPTKMNPEKEEDEMEDDEDDEMKESSNPGSSNAESYNVNGKKDGAIDTRTFTEKFQAAEQATEQSSENMAKPTTYNDPTKIKMDPEMDGDEMEDDEMEENSNAGISSNAGTNNVNGKKDDTVDTRTFSDKFQTARLGGQSTADGCPTDAARVQEEKNICKVCRECKNEEETDKALVVENEIAVREGFQQPQLLPPLEEKCKNSCFLPPKCVNRDSFKKKIDPLWKKDGCPELKFSFGCLEALIPDQVILGASIGVDKFSESLEVVFDMTTYEVGFFTVGSIDIWGTDSEIPDLFNLIPSGAVYTGYGWKGDKEKSL